MVDVFSRASYFGLKGHSSVAKCTKQIMLMTSLNNSATIQYKHLLRGPLSRYGTISINYIIPFLLELRLC